MKRTVLAIVIGTVVFGTVYGLAASLGVNSQTLGAGNSSVAACQSGSLTATYAVVYDATIPGYKVGAVTVTGLDTTSSTNCGSKAFKVTLTGPGASSASLAQVTGTTPGSGITFTADFTSTATPAANVTGVHLVITG
jgi:hypothetical protein